MGKATEIRKEFNKFNDLDQDEIDIDFATTKNVFSSACAVVDAIGPQFRREIIGLLCTRQLVSYNKVFARNKEDSSLDKVDRRLAWLKRILRAFDEQYTDVFPQHWRIQHRFSLEFCVQTRDSLIHHLAEAQENNDVKSLMNALGKIVQMERELKSVYELQNTRKESENEFEIDDDGELIDQNSAEAIKRRYRKNKQQKSLEGQIQDEEKAAEMFHRRRYSIVEEDKEEIDKGDELESFEGIVSKSFEPYMKPYIDAEKNRLDEILEKVTGETDINDDNTPVFNSSIELFLTIRDSINRCTRLINGQTFFNLQKVFLNELQSYANLLKSKLPKPATGPVVPHIPEHYRLNEGDEITICYVVTTCDYCSDTIPQLESQIKNKIDPAFSQYIEMSGVADSFVSTITMSITALVSGVYYKIDRELEQIKKRDWWNFRDVGDQSDYIVNISEILNQYVPIVKELFPPHCYKNFYDKLCRGVATGFYYYLRGSNRIGTDGAQQLLVDCLVLKGLLIRVPHWEDPDERHIPANSRFQNALASEMGKSDRFLKLILTPAEAMVDHFKVVWPDGTEDDLKTVLKLKGLNNADQRALLKTPEEKPVSTRRNFFKF